MRVKEINNKINNTLGDLRGPVHMFLISSSSYALGYIIAYLLGY